MTNGGNHPKTMDVKEDQALSPDDATLASKSGSIEPPRGKGDGKQPAQSTDSQTSR